MRESRAPGTSAAQVASAQVRVPPVVAVPETVGAPVALGDSTSQSDAMFVPVPPRRVACVHEPTVELRLMSPVLLA